nr:hypothetical protein BaRGS_028232 [Batillaria attramentaria]
MRRNYPTVIWLKGVEFRTVIKHPYGSDIALDDITLEPFSRGIIKTIYFKRKIDDNSLCDGNHNTRSPIYIYIETTVNHYPDINRGSDIVCILSKTDTGTLFGLESSGIHVRCFTSSGVFESQALNIKHQHHESVFATTDNTNWNPAT